MEQPRPLPLSSAEVLFDEPELRDLQALAQSGFAVAPIVVVPSAAEVQFYLLNNLEERLDSLFEEVDLIDPDDDDIDELAPEAERLVAGHFLLDEFIDAYYELIADLSPRLRVRRAGGSGAEYGRGRPALLGLKRTWVADWGFEPLWQRLRSGGPLLPAARTVLVHGAEEQRLPDGIARDASALLGRPLELRGNPQLGVTRVRDAGT